MIGGLIAVFGIVFGLTLFANFIVRRQDPGLNLIFDILLILFNIPLLLLGILLLFLPPDLLNRPEFSELPLSNLASAGAVLIGMAIWGILVVIRPFRRLLARALPIDAQSAVHTWALILAGYLVGNTAISLTQDLLENLSQLAIPVNIGDVVLQGVAFALLAYAAVGLLVRRNWREASQRLGFKKLTGRRVGLAFLWVIVLVIFQALIGGLWALLDPEASQDLVNINEALLSGLDSVGEWFLLALSAGVGEELLFRGALQPAFGLGFTSFLFAAVHVQYGITPVTGAVFLIGIILGLIRRKEGTAVAILVHFGYNFALGLLSMLAVFLEQFVP